MKPMSRLAAVLVALLLAVPVSAQTVVKYGADFLANGVGARALGMGGAYVAHADDVSAAYWNVSGLQGIQHPEAAYMHAERFGGLVAFDYGAIAWPLSANSSVAVSFVRSGVDDIASTLRAYNPETGLPLPNPQDNIELFSAADNALFVSYARGLGERLAVGASAKVVRRGIGDFASAWGYSMDLGVQADLGRVQLGATLQDVTGMIQAWSVNDDAFADFETTFGTERPVGLTEIVLPVARLGAASRLPITRDVGVTLATDLDLAFDGQSANAIDAGGVSLRPRVGTELDYKGVLAFRAGIADVTRSDRFGTQVTPTVGVGVQAGRFDIDYGFGDFAGAQADLDVSHRVSLRYRLASDRWARRSE